MSREVKCYPKVTQELWHEREMSQAHESTKFNQKIAFHLCRTVTERVEKEKWKPETLWKVTT